MIEVSLPDELLAKLDETVAMTGKKRKTSKPFYEILVEEFEKSTELVTDATKTPFTMFSDEKKLYVLNAKGNTRSLDEASVNQFFEEFKTTGSTKTTTYQGITFNSSYLLSALKYLMQRELI